MDKQKLLAELKESFDNTKKELNFKSTFEEINESCYIEDAILSNGAVSNQYSRQLINRIVETSYSWVGTLHSAVFPSQDLISMNESKSFSQEEKKEIMRILGKIMYFVRKNKKIAFKRGKEEEGKFVDEIMDFYKSSFNPFMLKFNEKLELFWKKDSESIN